ncbi:hypothetical protein CMV_011549 [Castanea mollissima]|uniref:Uncharacterized protein n=1 Tax=Castanea mollissima TaxID=60419 RepID=A0A8J4RH92_9ROSI|nr:hypothetical protein CMV_011549 [Castanea mollissima]
MRTSTHCWEQLLLGSEGHVKECSGSESLSWYELNVDLLHTQRDILKAGQPYPSFSCLTDLISFRPWVNYSTRRLFWLSWKIMEVLRKIVMLLPMANKMPRWAYGISFSFLRCLDKDFFLEDDSETRCRSFCLAGHAVNDREIWLSLRYLQLMMTFYPMHSKGQLILARSRAWKVQPY